MIRTYSELSKLPSYFERFAYLRLDGSVGVDTFGFDRYLSQAFYRSSEWRKARNEVIVRDGGCDLGVEDRPVYSKILIHHMNPVTVDQVRLRDGSIFDPEYLICVSFDTHNAIHYGNDSTLSDGEPIFRSLGDTKLW